jgi:phosphoribosylaminoimidazole-succinocarboxamide synthase
VSRSPLTAAELPLPLHGRGKVRDMYDAGGNRLLMVATDRLSAFDVIMAEPIPRKGEVLTAVTAWWLAQLGDLIDHHLIEADPYRIARLVPALDGSQDRWAGRALLVQRTRPIPVECVVRGYLAGSAWQEYRELGTLAGEPLPLGLRQADRLDPPVFSPATKATSGHDENIPYQSVVDRLGGDLAARLRGISLALYDRGRRLASERGIILADTKFEFGLTEDGRLLLIDEVMTPDSSRFWPQASYEPGRTQPSLDKQPVRDYLEALYRDGRWDKAPPPPPLPRDVIAATTERYLDVYHRLTGREPDR